MCRRTLDNTLERDVKQSILCLPVRRLYGSSPRPVEHVDRRVVCGQRTDVVVGNAAIHSAVVRLHVVQG